MDLNVPSGTNPQDVVEQSTGKYDDAAARLPDAQRTPNMPAGPDPQPYQNGRKVGPSGG